MDKTQGDARTLLNQAPGKVHLVGICGVGMAGLAFLLKQRGWHVTGCDKHAAGSTAEWLRAEGVEVVEGHSPEHVGDSTDWAIRSAAVSLDEPELRHALRLGITVSRRGEVLPALLEGRISVAVCGTHGKTTTSTWLAFILKYAGLEPSWCIGGRSTLLGEVAGAGSGKHMVVEADESDGTLSLYEVDFLVVTNIDFDHMEHFADVTDFENTFAHAISRARRGVIYCRDDVRAAKLGARRRAGATSYGVSPDADVRAEGVKAGPWESEFELIVRGKAVGRIRVPAPGMHNVLNALACAATAFEMGLDAELIRDALVRVALPARRFEVVGDVGGAVVVSDYAHHPAEVRALVRAALGLGRRRIIAVFQPHRHTRTRALAREFPAAFEGVNELILLPVYSASEAEVAGGMGGDLYAAFREQCICNPVVLALSHNAVWEYVKRRLQPEDLFLVIGAGDVDRIAKWAADKKCTWMRTEDTGLPLLSSLSKIIKDEPLSVRTSFGVGGVADIWAEVGTIEDLVTLQRWALERGMPLRVLGAGSNVLVSDMGLRGVTARLTGECFRKIEPVAGGVRVGAGVTMASFLSWCEANGVGGYEFLEGIPGTVGGGVRMNAGAWGSQLGDFVAEVSVLDASGTTVTRRTGEPGGPEFDYRSSFNIDGIITEVILRTDRRAGRAEISGRRTEISAAREWMKGKRCAGSVFKNPAGDAAGRLIESAGLKGWRIGGAVVSERHANVIIAGDGALASDVLALIEIVRSRVRAATGIYMELEVVVLE